MVWRWIEAGDLWKDGAQSLQLRLRERFRVAVDRRRRTPTLPSGCFSSNLRRCINRFYNIRRDTLPSSSAFYRKRVSGDLDSEEDSVLTRMLQAVAVPVIGNVCHVFMHGLNRVQIYGAEKLHEALLHRPADKPLITVSNHVASMDDPLVIASLLPPKVMFDVQSARWTLCATDRCFRNPVTSAFFKYVKVLPVSRGDGIYQKGMDMAIAKLNCGGWVHIFPEGSRSRDGGKTMGSSKRGIGRLVLDADRVPLVVPFVHTGMQDVMPVGASFPRIGKMVTVLVGDPIVLDDLLDVEENQNLSRGKLYDAVAARIGDRLQKLKAQVDKLAAEESLKLQNYASHGTDRATGILQQVDWESLGMESYVGTENYSLTPSPDQIADMKQATEFNEQREEQNGQSDRYFRIDLSYEGGMVSRIRGYMDPTELMGFAAKGLFANCRRKEASSPDLQGVGPLRAWNNFWQLIHHHHHHHRDLSISGVLADTI